MPSVATIKSNSSDWVDIADQEASIASTPVTLQNVGSHEIRIFFGGGSAPSDDLDGFLLQPMDTITDSAANIWAKGWRGLAIAAAL